VPSGLLFRLSRSTGSTPSYRKCGPGSALGHVPSCPRVSVGCPLCPVPCPYSAVSGSLSVGCQVPARFLVPSFPVFCPWDVRLTRLKGITPLWQEPSKQKVFHITRNKAGSQLQLSSLLSVRILRSAESGSSPFAFPTFDHPISGGIILFSTFLLSWSAA